ncbi:hypothetical protein SDC9_38245 [bioreactor metagenome]|uniref:TraG N-terminal Proteobacteria domain-containing protein n=1 Tax=bioreactor metagenome TaxID=1076179 RepID=A0A644VLC3_9ZZZZ
MHWEIYTTGGAYYLYDIFNMLGAYTSSGNFKNLLQIGLVIGILWISLQLAFGGSLGGAMKYVFTTVLVMTFTLGPKSSVVIIDKTSGTVPIYGVVDNVPTPIAMLGHYTSGVSYFLTGQMETLMSTPTDLTYQKNGILFGASLMAQSANWRAVTPKIHENLVNFMQQCVIDATNLGHMDLELVATTGDMESFIAANMPASMAYYDVVSGETRTCSAGWNDVKAAVTAEVDKVLEQKAASTFQGVNASGAANVNRLKSTLTEFQGLMAMSSASSVHTVKQAMFVTAMDDGLQRFIATSGNSAAMEIYQAARADIQTRSSYAAIGANATKWVPLLKIVFESLYYAAFPMAVMMMMTPLAIPVLKGYMGGFVWLAAWEPLSAILHSIVIKASTGFYREAGAVTTDGAVSDVVMSWANHFGIRAVEQDVGSVAGYLMMSVPFLATAIMFGANRMVGMATSMLNVGQGAAIESGREAATGQISLGNMSMNNYQANKANMSSMVDIGRDSMVARNGAVVTQNADRGMSWSSGSAMSTGATTSAIGEAVRSEVATRADSARTAASSAAAEVSDFLASGASAITSFGQSYMSGSQGVTSKSTDSQVSEGSKVSQAYQRVEEFAKSQGISTQLAVQAALAGDLGVGGKFGPAQGKLGANLNGRLEGVSAERFDELVKAAETAGVTKDVGYLNSARSSMGATATDGKQTTTGEDMRYSREEGERAAQTFISRLEEARTYSEAQSRLESGGTSMDTNLNQIVGRELVDRGMSPLETGAVFNPQTPAELRTSRDIIGGVVDDVVDGLVGTAPADQTRGWSPSIDQSGLRTELPRQATMSDGSVISLDGQRDKVEETIRDNRSAAEDDSANLRNYQNQQYTEGMVMQEATKRPLQEGADQWIGTAMGNRVVGWLNVNGEEVDMLRRAHPEVWNTPGKVYDYYTQHPEQYQEVLKRPFVDGDELPASPENQTAAIYPAPLPGKAMSAEERDTVIRTVIGEAANQGNAGMAAVALVIRNRADDARFPDAVGQVSLQPKQFSAWNADGSGNSLVNKYRPGDPAYERAAYVVDVVMAGLVPDFTGGATHYFAPAGMRALVEQGYQKNLIPGWLERETEARNAPPIRVGDHVFTGQVQPKG